jgi:hypothetical protein
MAEGWICDPQFNDDGTEKPIYRLYPGKGEYELILNRCPAAFVEPETEVIFRFYIYWKEGRLGTYWEQPATGVQAYELIEEFLALAK